MKNLFHKLWEPSFFLTTMGIIATFALLIAFVAQYAFKILPCPLCIYERYLYMGILSLALVSFFQDHPFFLPLMNLLIGIGVALSIYHLGVEFLWWKAPSSCTGAPVDAINFEDFQAQFMKKPLARCDRVRWVIFGFSATLWNVFLFVGCGVYSLISKIKSPR